MNWNGSTCCTAWRLATIDSCCLARARANKPKRLATIDSCCLARARAELISPNASKLARETISHTNNVFHQNYRLRNALYYLELLIMVRTV
jgi:hypothetical protein